MNHETAFALVAEICPAQAGLLWDTTNHTGCDTATAVADQYDDGELTEARHALERLANDEIPFEWQTHRRLHIGDRVDGGTGDDYDRGTVDRIDGDQVTVRWDSLVVTTQPAELLRKI